MILLIALGWLRGTIEVHDEMDEMRQEQASMKLVPKVTLKEMITNSSLRQPLIIAMMMMLAQQLSGINCAIFYSTSIFREAGLNDEASQGATLGMGSMNVLMTVVSLVLILLFFVTEQFSQSGRPTATSIAVTVNWSANLLVGLALVPLQVRDRIKPVKRVVIVVSAL